MDKILDLIQQNLGLIVLIGAFVLPSLLPSAEKRRAQERRRGQPAPSSKRPVSDPLDMPSAAPSRSAPSADAEAETVAESRPSQQPSSAREWLEEMLRPLQEELSGETRAPPPRKQVEPAGPTGAGPAPAPLERSVRPRISDRVAERAAARPRAPSINPERSTTSQLRPVAKSLELASVAPPMELERTTSLGRPGDRDLRSLKGSAVQAGRGGQKIRSVGTPRAMSRARALLGGKLDQTQLRRAVLLREILDVPLSLRQKSGWDNERRNE